MIAQIKALGGPARHFESDRSLSCHNCPDVVQALNLLAVLFQDEVTQRKLMAVPTVCMNGAVLNQGRMGIDVQVHTRVRTTGISGNGERLAGLRYPTRPTRPTSPDLPAEAHQIALEGLFVQIGLAPNTEWLKDTLRPNRQGEIEVDARGATSLAGLIGAAHRPRPAAMTWAALTSVHNRAFLRVAQRRPE